MCFLQILLQRQEFCCTLSTRGSSSLRFREILSENNWHIHFCFFISLPLSEKSFIKHSSLDFIPFQQFYQFSLKSWYTTDKTSKKYLFEHLGEIKRDEARVISRCFSSQQELNPNSSVSLIIDPFLSLLFSPYLQVQTNHEDSFTISFNFSCILDVFSQFLCNLISHIGNLLLVTYKHAFEWCFFLYKVKSKEDRSLICWYSSQQSNNL